MKITIYGKGCPSCRKLSENARTAVNNLGIDAEVNECKDINIIAAEGVLRTPGLGIDHNIVSQGKILNVADIENLIREKM